MYVFLRKTAFKKQRYVLVIFKAFTLEIGNNCSSIIEDLFPLPSSSVFVIILLRICSHMSALLQEDNCSEENWVILGSVFHMVKYEGVKIFKFPKMGLRGRT